MQHFCLEISGEDCHFRWQIRHRSDPGQMFQPFLQFEPVYASFMAALDSGSVMLARACGQPYVSLAD